MLGSKGAPKGVHFAVRPLVIAKHLGMLLIPLACLTIVPALVSAFCGRLDMALRYAVIVAALLALGVPAARLRCTSAIQTNEALTVTALIFVLSACAMSYPMHAYGFAFVDALFEAVSGVTTTGLSTLPSVEDQSPAFLFSRAWTQWVGGLGVVVLALALLMDAGQAAGQLGFDRREREDVVGSTRGHAQRILVVYVGLTLLGVAALLSFGLGPLDSIAQAMAAISTGGFATKDASLAGFQSIAVRTVVLIICLAGAISFGWYYGGYYRNPLVMLRDERLRVLAIAMALCAGLMIWLGEAEISLDAVGHAVAMAISAQSTAGFATVPITEASTQLVLIGSMLVGGEVGSTAGGVKVLRALILFRLLQLVLARAAVPKGTHLRIRVAGDRVTPREVELALAIICGYLIIISLSWLIFLDRGIAPMAALFDVVSATTTTGLSSGVTSADLDPALKLVLCVDMLMGRVETVALIVLLYPRTWIGMRRRAA